VPSWNDLVQGKVVRGLPDDPDLLRVRRDRCHEAVSAARALPPAADGHVVLARLRWAFGHAQPAARLVVSAARLPRVQLQLGNGVGGRALNAQLRAHCGGTRPWQTLGRSVYVVPADGRAFPGRAHHSRRSAVNQARRAGIVVRVLTVAEALAEPSVVAFGPCPWAAWCEGRTYAAFHPDGHAIAVSHVHVDGSLAELAQAMQQDGEPLTAQARFAVFSALVEDLAAAEVELLVVLASWVWSAAGTREFQNLLGFQPVQIQVTPQGLGKVDLSVM
jgi:hypothetical protein